MVGEEGRGYCCLAAKCFAVNWLCIAQAFCHAAHRIQPTPASRLPLWKVSKVLVLNTKQNCIANVSDLLRRESICGFLVLSFLVYCSFLKPVSSGSSEWYLTWFVSATNFHACSGSLALLHCRAVARLVKTCSLLIQHTWPDWRSTFSLAFFLASISLSLLLLSLGCQVISRGLHAAGLPAPGALK